MHVIALPLIKWPRDELISETSDDTRQDNTIISAIWGLSDTRNTLFQMLGKWRVERGVIRHLARPTIITHTSAESSASAVK